MSEPSDWAHLLVLLDAEVRSRSASHLVLDQDEIWLEVSRRVRGIAERILSELPREDLEDVIQAVLLKLQSLHVIEQVRAARFPMGYVMVMIRNTAHDLARQQVTERDALQRLGKHFVESFVSQALEEPAPEDRLSMELFRLSDEEREILRLRFWEGLKIGEIAARRGGSYSAVAVRLFRLLRRLEDRLREPETDVSRPR
jgi:RNA polymerase sigma factor (sigma-70 family)